MKNGGYDANHITNLLKHPSQTNYQTPSRNQRTNSYAQRNAPTYYNCGRVGHISRNFWSKGRSSNNNGPKINNKPTKIKDHRPKTYLSCLKTPDIPLSIKLDKPDKPTDVTQRLKGNQNQMDTQPGGQLADQNLEEQDPD